jgi:hypothetical protein
MTNLTVFVAQVERFRDASVVGRLVRKSSTSRRSGDNLAAAAPKSVTDFVSALRRW